MSLVQEGVENNVTNIACLTFKKMNTNRLNSFLSRVKDYLFKKNYLTYFCELLFRKNSVFCAYFKCIENNVSQNVKTTSTFGGHCTSSFILR